MPIGFSNSNANWVFKWFTRGFWQGVRLLISVVIVSGYYNCCSTTTINPRIVINFRPALLPLQKLSYG